MNNSKMRNFIAIVLYIIQSFLYGQKGDLSSYTTTTSGMKYKIFTQSDRNKMVRINDRVSMVYSLKLTDGTLIDASENYQFIVGQNEGLKGWDEALVLLSVKDSAEFYIPSELAYGNRKVGKIPVNSTVIFNVKIIAKVPAYFEYTTTDFQELNGGVKKFLIKEGETKVEVYNYVLLAYTGYLYTEEGQRRIFDQSNGNNNLAFYQLGAGKFIPGLEMAIRTMKVGEKSTFVVPPELGYGNNDQGVIPKNSKLYFDLELLSQLNPFYSFEEKEVFLSGKGVRLCKLHGKYLNVNTEQKILNMHILSYYFNQEGGRVILKNTHEGKNEPIKLRIGSKYVSPEFSQALKYLTVGDTCLIIISKKNSKSRENLSDNLMNRTIFHQVEVVDMFDYPILKPKGKDTLQSKSGTKYLDITKSNNKKCVDSNSVVSLILTGYNTDEKGNINIFESSLDANQLISVNMSKKEIVAGLKEVLYGMRIGESRKAMVYNFSEAERKTFESAGVKTNRGLIFDINIVDINN